MDSKCHRLEEAILEFFECIIKSGMLIIKVIVVHLTGQFHKQMISEIHTL